MDPQNLDTMFLATVNTSQEATMGHYSHLNLQEREDIMLL